MRVVDVSFQRSENLAYGDVSIHLSFTDKRRFYMFERELETDPKWQLMAIRET